MAWLKRAAIVLALAVIAFVGFLLGLDNSAPVALRMLNFETEPVPVFWWLYAAFALGLATGFAFCALGFIRGKFVIRRLRRAIRQRDDALARLRGVAPDAAGGENASP